MGSRPVRIPRVAANVQNACNGLRDIKQRLPNEKELVYEFARKLRSCLYLTRRSELGVADLASLIKHLLVTEYLNVPVMDRERTKKYSAAELIFDQLPHLLAHTAGPLVASLVMERLNRSGRLVQYFKTKVTYGVH